MTWRGSWLPALAAGVVTLWACGSDSPAEPVVVLPEGTWGGEQVGVIVNDVLSHVHVGCTKGDFPAPIALDEDGRFSVEGDYLVRAYPVALGPTMPAVFAGVLRGDDLTFTVAVNDTIEERLVVFGPVAATLGREPDLGPCPICVEPGEAVGARGSHPPHT